MDDDKKTRMHDGWQASAAFTGVSGRGLSIFQYSPYTTWSVTGLRFENSFFGSRDHEIGGMPAVAGSPCEESTRLIYISRELRAVFQAVQLSASSAMLRQPRGL